MSGIKPSSAFGVAISSRIVVSKVVKFIDGVHEPCDYISYHNENRVEIFGV